MNKETFLKELIKKLSILSDEEKNEIKLEYQDIIEQKVKHGKTEEEAVKEFGDINKLSKEILAAYKINPNYKKDCTKEFFGDVESAIKNGAKKLSNATEDVVDSMKNSNNEITLEKVFEIIIKVIAVLLCLAILKIPFFLVEEFGERIFESSNVFLGGNALSFIWKVLVEVIYLVVCVLLFCSIFVKKNKNDIEKTELIKKDTSKKEEIKNEKKEVKSNERIIKQKKENNNILSSLIIILVKIWAFIIFLIPLWFINIGMLIGLCVIVFLIIKGILLIGPFLLTLGLITMGFYIFKIIFKALFSEVKIHIYPFIISLVLIIIGSLMTMDYIIGFKYYDYLPQNNYKIETKTFKQKITKEIDLDHFGNYELILNNKLKDNEINIETIYYSDFIKVNGIDLVKFDDCENDEDCNRETLLYDLKYVEKEEFAFNDPLVNLVVDNFKKQKIYNYGLFSEASSKIYANKKTMKLLKED